MDEPRLNCEDEAKDDVEPVKPICRGCLMTERRMRRVVLYAPLINDLTGITVTESDGLPQWLCYECSALLIKAVRFKRKMLRAHDLLYQYLTRCAPFAIDSYDDEISKYASPHLTGTSILTNEVGFKNKSSGWQVSQHEKLICTKELDDIILPVINKLDSDDVKEELGFSDYDDNITLDELRSSTNKITEDDLETLLRESENIDIKTESDINLKKKKKSKKKESKIKKNKESDVNFDAEESKSSIRKPVEIDPSKIRTITLNPEEQIRQKEEEAQAGVKFPFHCKLCHRGFNFAYKLENHMTKHSPSRGTYECKLCHMFLPTPYSYSVHNLIHTRRYECVECGRRMIDKNSIVDHYRTQHEGLLSVYTCHLCGKISNNSKTHRGHMRNHHGSEVRPKCDQCGKTFVNKDSLSEHIQIHQGIKHFECGTCGKRFRTRTQIKLHQMKHSDSKDFYCVECDVRFKTAQSLRTHLQKSLKHKDKQSFIYSCTSCDKRFETNEALTSHCRIQHEGIRTHICNICGAALATRSSLLKHTNYVHERRRAPPRHVCHTCGKAFRGKSVLTNHVRTHTGEKPFECATCGRKFSQRTAMRTHVKLVHLKLRRHSKIKPELPLEPLPQPPKLEVFKPEPNLEPWRQPCDVFFQVTAGP
ncbi:uncharacterized protein LOC142985417 isoform X2 [Anticarsia gemmatalis]|uniref:uncharacterized protein LOC142985417 isoform X2 n=1 Tax=Anticarsia gemmatalis TaxID=129554 RepID=UPI003F769074